MERGSIIYHLALKSYCIVISDYRYSDYSNGNIVAIRCFTDQEKNNWEKVQSDKVSPRYFVKVRFDGETIWAKPDQIYTFPGRGRNIENQYFTVSKRDSAKVIHDFTLLSGISKELIGSARESLLQLYLRDELKLKKRLEEQKTKDIKIQVQKQIMQEINDIYEGKLPKKLQRLFTKYY